MSPPAPQHRLAYLREWLMDQIDGSIETRGDDGLISDFIRQIDALSEKGATVEPRGCPIPGACSAVEELADLKQRILPQFAGRAQRAEHERDALLEQLIAARSATAATDRPDWAQQLPGAEIFDRSNDAQDAVRYKWIREQYYCPPGTLLDQAIDAAIREESDK